MKKSSRYLPIDEDLFSSPIFVTSVGRSLIPPAAPYPPPGHPDLYQFNWREGRVLPEFSLLWVEAGSGIWETKKGSVPIQTGQVGLVVSGQWHRYRPDPKTGWAESWIHFNGRLAHELESGGLLSGTHPVRTPANPRRFAKQFREFLNDILAPDFINSLAQGLRLIGLLGLLENPSRPPESVTRSLIENARHYIWNHSHRQLNVGEIADHLKISRRTLERAFVAEDPTHSVLEEINQCRLNRAERLLRETRLPVQDVVNLSGFGTAEQMRLHFQSRHGISPALYRRSDRNGFGRSL